MLTLTLIFVVLQCALAVSSPVKFVLFSLWVQTIPYTWNWDAQGIFETPVGPLNVTAMQLFGFCFASALALLSRLQGAIRSSKALRLHGLFICLACLSLVYGHSFMYGLRMIAKLLGPVLFLATVLGVMNTEQNLKSARTAILGSGIVLLGLALYARAMGYESDPNANVTGVSGLGPPSMGPPVFSAHMLPVTMLALSLYVSERRWSLLAVTVISACAILAALQRTSAAAMFMGCALILFWGGRGIWRYLLPGLGILGLPLLLVFNDTFRRRMFFSDTSSEQVLSDPSKMLGSLNSSGRFEMWSSMLQRYFEPNRLLGSGVGSTQEYFYTHGGAGVVHSEYVRLLCEVGILGLVLFVLALLGYMRLLRRYVVQMRREGTGNAYALAASGALLTYVVYCSTDNAFDYVSQFGIYVFGLIGMAVKARALTAQQTQSVPVRIPMGVPFPNLMR